MHLDTNISEKDKRLLMYVAIAAVVALMVRFLIMPAMDRTQELEEAIDSAATTREERRIRLHELEYLDEAIEQRQKELDEVSAPYYTPMATREMDDLITGLVIKHGMFPERLSLSEAEPGMTPAYLYQMGTADAEGAPDGEAPMEPAAEAFLEMTPDYLLLATAEMEVSGDLSGWYALLDDLTQLYPSLRVTMFDITEERYVTEEMETFITNRIKCELELYMCRKGEGA